MSLNDINISQIIISRPKKSDTTYVCPIYYENDTRDKLSCVLDNLLLVAIKPLQQRNEFFIYVKNKKINNFIYDLSKHIVEFVKDKSSAWFNNNMNTELIDDYFTNTLVYDKEKGDIIRLKIIGDESVLEDYINKKIKLTLIFDNLRFYRQKFVLESKITDIESVTESFDIKPIDNQEESSDDEYEEPSPSKDDIENIRAEILKISTDYIDDLKNKCKKIEVQIAKIEKIRNELVDQKQLNLIVPLCEELESLCVS